MKRVRRNKAQSVLEYVIILTTIVLVIFLGIQFLGLTTSRTVDQTKGLGKLMSQMNTTIQKQSQKLRDNFK